MAKIGRRWQRELGVYARSLAFFHPSPWMPRPLPRWGRGVSMVWEAAAEFRDAAPCTPVAASTSGRFGLADLVVGVAEDFQEPLPVAGMHRELDGEEVRVGPRADGQGRQLDQLGGGVGDHLDAQ